MIPAWLVAVLDRELPNHTGGERDRLAFAIVAAIPRDRIATAIRDAAVGTLASRNILDHGASVSRELGVQASDTVLRALAEAG